MRSNLEIEKTLAFPSYNYKTEMEWIKSTPKLSTYDTSIRIRISKKDKDTLSKLSRKDKKSISNYILHKSLYENTISSLTLAEQIDIINFINDIYHKIDSSDDKHLKAEVKKLCNSYLLNSERKNENE